MNENDNSSRLLFEGEELRLPAPSLFIEFSITGEEKWTIYAGTEFNGKSRCLSRFGQFQPGHLRKYRFRREIVPDFGETWLIGSARRGCFPISFPGYGFPEDEVEEEDEEDEFWKNQNQKLRDEFEWPTTVATVRNGTNETVPDGETGISKEILEDDSTKTNSGIIPTLSLAFPLMFLKLLMGMCDKS